MKSSRFLNSKFYRILDYVLRLIILNFLIVIPSFSFMIIYSLFRLPTEEWYFYLTLIPICIYLFPAIVASFNVIIKYELDESNTIFKEFFKSLKEVYLKSLLGSIILIIVFILMYNSLNFFIVNATTDIIYLIGLFLSLSFSIMFIFMVVHLPLNYCYFKKLNFFDYYKLSFMMAFKGFGITAIMTLIVIAIGSIAIFNYYVMFFMGFTLPIFFLVKLSFKQYIKIYRKVEN